MKTKIYLFSFLALLLLTLYITVTKKNDIPTKNEEHHWSYSGETSPEHWAEIEKKSACGGKHQSPINIIHNEADSIPEKNQLKIFYSPTTLVSRVDNNGHSIQFNFEKGDSINYENETYYLKQIHFHEPSEHKINGIIYPIEMHLVHVNKAGRITVLGFMGEEGEESQLFEFLESFLPLSTGTTKNIHQKLDLSSLFNKDDSYYSYNGSLTTPPCTEGVNWVVFKHPIVLSVEEVLKLKSNMPVNNYRNEQPLNNRLVKLNY